MEHLKEAPLDLIQKVKYDTCNFRKRAGIQIGSKDVLNITGGINVDDPSIDLAVISSIISSHENIPINRNVVFQVKLDCLENFVVFQNLKKD